MGGLGNLMLSTYFASQHEWAAVRVQAVGAITTFIVTTGLGMALGRALQVIPDRWFSIWQEVTTPIGLGALIVSVLDTIALPMLDTFLDAPTVDFARPRTA